MSQEPPEVIMYRNKKKLKLGKKKKATNLEQEVISFNPVSPSRSDSVSSVDLNQVSQSSSRPGSPTLSESNSSVNDDSNFGTEPLPTIQTPSMFSREYVQPSEFLSDCLFDGDDPMDNLLDDDDDDESLDLTDSSEHYDELKKEYQDQKNNQSMSKYPTNFSEFNKHWSNFKEGKNLDEQDEDDEDDQDEDSSDSEEINREPQVSLFHQTTRRTEPWKKNYTLGDYLIIIIGLNFN